MTDQELAKALLQAGLVTGQQVQAAVQQRVYGVGFAEALVDMGAVTAEQVMAIYPYAFGVAEEATQAYNGQAAADEHVGLGQGAGHQLDDSGVIFEGEMSQTREESESASPIVKYVNELLKYAVEIRASDMHFEPRADGLLARYRVDGHLRTGSLVPTEIQAPIISRLKVLGGLDITESRLPQDGRFRAIIGGRIFDFRVSSMPSLHGEKIVLRLLDRSSLVTDLTRLGFDEDSRELFTQMLQRSHGMILVTGPTGSGKTTTLYAALAAARDETKNVVTVEDPVEYELEGVTQTNVQADIGLTFAAQLRAILRQDPDVILVGEIRDNETADISVRAALTGHLLLSTLHTNSAVAAVTRLQDMDVPSFLIASSLSGVLAQRLVRLICRQCRVQLPFDSPEYAEHAATLRLSEGFPLYYGAGCEECNGTGSRGRLAIVELLNVNTELRRAIMEKADAGTLRRIAVESGMKTLWQDGIDKLQRGLTNADEIARVLLGSEHEEFEE